MKLSALVPTNTNTVDTQSGLPFEKKKVNILICLLRQESSFSRQTNAISTKQKDHLFTSLRLHGNIKTCYGHEDAEFCANTTRILEMLYYSKITLFVTSTSQLTELYINASRNVSAKKKTDLIKQ
jgi:hypothetical protein